MKVYETFSEAETRELAYQIGRKSKPTEIYCLSGELGTGKTVFAKGFAEGIGITDEIVSPTFGIVNEYMDKQKLYHFDVYRINSVLEMEDTGFEDYFYGDGICLIEWAELISDLIPEEAVWIRIEKDYSKNDQYRKIVIEKNK